MKRYLFLLSALVLSTGTLIWMVARRPVVAEAEIPSMLTPRQERFTSPAITPPPPASQPPLAPELTPPTPQNADLLPPLIADETQAKERVRLLGATFDEAHVPELVRYLSHSSAEVRSRALGAILMIGDATAAPYLRAAANEAERHPETVAEAQSFREIADVLSAPKAPGEPVMPKRSLAELEAAGREEKTHPLLLSKPKQ